MSLEIVHRVSCIDKNYSLWRKRIKKKEIRKINNTILCSIHYRNEINETPDERFLNSLHSLRNLTRVWHCFLFYYFVFIFYLFLSSPLSTSLTSPLKEGRDSNPSLLCGEVPHRGGGVLLFYSICHTRARIVNEWNELQQFFIGYLVNSISSVDGTENSIIIFSYLFFLSRGVGSPKTRWAGCKLVCNHELVVPLQFAEAKEPNT